jgi:surfeit locus 1 family protein
MTHRQQQGSDPASPEAAARPRSRAMLVFLALCAALTVAVLLALGTWQLQRLQWKNALIERIAERVHAAPVPVPGPERWPDISADSDEYRRVRASGIFLHQFSTRVQAVTEHGSGYWLLTPLRTTDGNIVLVNRGFIPLQGRETGGSGAQPGTGEHAAAGNRQVSVTGLLRISEPGGGFLRKNDPLGNRWYSRDVQAIAAAHGLSDVAPYFIDADATPAPDDATIHPVGGLTVLSFPNNHLIYAVTWYALALMLAGAAFWVARDERRLRRAARDPGRH